MNSTGTNNVIVNFMAADEDDSEAEAELKMVVQDVRLWSLN